ncbi:MAG: zinc ABC transporter substrate-binding protein [Parcubacteria group bacterium]|nr:zinc ABC transporter substrate-binding protein [Parcubacteria group bacterium]
MNIFEEVKKLNLPAGKYVVVGSGAMAARGIREAGDVDLLVTQDIFDALEKSGGWQTEFKPDGRKSIKKDICEVCTDFICGRYQLDSGELIQNADVIDGIPFMKLEELVKFKTELGREKDLRDIELIQNYLKTQTKI